MRMLLELDGFKEVVDGVVDLKFIAVYNPKKYKNEPRFVKAVPFGYFKIRIDNKLVVEDFRDKVGKLFSFVISEAQETLLPLDQEKGP